MLKSLIKRDFTLIFSNKLEIAQLIIFLAIVNFIFSFSLSQVQNDLKYPICVAVILVNQIISMNLAKRWIFERDYEIGILQQIYLSKASNNSLVLSKVFSNYLLFGLPIAIFAPITVLFFNLETLQTLNIVICVVISGVLISTVNVMLSALTLGVKNGGIISIILSIPLLMPVLILNSAFLLSTNQNLENLISGSLGLEITFYILALFATKIGVASASSD